MPFPVETRFDEYFLCAKVADRFGWGAWPVPRQDMDNDVRVLLVSFNGSGPIRATISYPRRRPPMIVRLGTRTFERLDKDPINARGELRYSLRVFHESVFQEARSLEVPEITLEGHEARILEAPEPAREEDGPKKSVWEHLRGTTGRGE
jgi:hypothetical protein